MVKVACSTPACPPPPPNSQLLRGAKFVVFENLRFLQHIDEFQKTEECSSCSGRALRRKKNEVLSRR